MVYNIIIYSSILYISILYSIILYSIILYSIIIHSIIRCSITRYSISFSEGISKKKVPDPGGHSYTVVVKEFFSLKYFFVIALYVPTHEHSNVPLIAVKGPTVDC